MATLTPEQKTLLASIVNDKFSVGAFSGMIFNALTHWGPDFSADDIDNAVSQALTVRLRMMELAK